jgi:hypothetical protein
MGNKSVLLNFRIYRMINRKRQDYNDVGWGIHDGNYERFLTQIDPGETSTGWWHVGPEQSVYSRFARSINHSIGNHGLFFDLDPHFIKDSKRSNFVLFGWMRERFNGP